MKSLAKYDLTTREGLGNAAKDGGLAYLALIAVGPLGLLGFALYKLFSVEKEADVAADLIRQGKANGVSEMRIKLRKKAALKLGGDVEGIPLKVEGDLGNTVVVHVRYR
jgi:hypothetical protein